MWLSIGASANNDKEVQVLISFHFDILQMQNLPVAGLVSFFNMLQIQCTETDEVKCSGSIFYIYFTPKTK